MVAINEKIIIWG